MELERKRSENFSFERVYSYVPPCTSCEGSWSDDQNSGFIPGSRESALGSLSDSGSKPEAEYLLVAVDLSYSAESPCRFLLRLGG